LVTFKDEVQKEKIKPVDLEERKKKTDELLSFYKKKCWMLLDLDKDGKVKIFDEEKLEEIKEKYRKK